MTADNRPHDPYLAYAELHGISRREAKAILHFAAYIGEVPQETKTMPDDLESLKRLPVHRLRWMLKHANREVKLHDRIRKNGNADIRALNDYLDAQRWVDAIEAAIAHNSAP